MPKLATLIDTFDAGIGVNWSTVGRGTLWDSATKSANLNVNVNYNGTLATSGLSLGWDLTASYFYGKFTLPTPTSTFEIYVTLQSDSNNLVQMAVTGQNMLCQVRTAGTNNNVVNTPYVAANHGPWWRMREAGGTVFFEASRDGQTWTTLGSVATPAFVNNMAVSISTGQGATAPYGNVFIDYVNSIPYDPWVLMTGPKGSIGTQRPAPTSPVRRYCSSASAPNASYVSGGFLFNTGYLNYYPTVDPGQWYQLQATRNPQGRVVIEGLLTVTSTMTTTLSIFSLPWDMIPYPAYERITTIGDANNARARFDIFWDNNYGWHYSLVASQVNVISGTFIGVHCAYQTYLPVCWVDYGMKVDITGWAVGGNYVTYTVAPGQISGYLKGVPFTQVFPNPTTLTLTYPHAGNQQALFYYDVAAQQFNHNWYGLPGTSPLPDADFTVWGALADRGQVVLASHVPAYSTGDIQTFTLTDHRFLMRGSLDTPVGV